MLKRTLSQVALAVAALSATGAQAALTDGHFGVNQIFDVQYYWNGNYLNASNFIAPYDMNFSHPNLSAGQYFAFFASTTNPGTYGLGLYNSNGSLAQVVHNTGTLQAIGPGAIFYIGSGFFGTVITTDQGFAYGSSASFGNMNTNPQASDFTGYTWASTTPLSAGQSAPPPGPPAPSSPTVVSSTTTNQVTSTSTSGQTTTTSTSANGQSTSTTTYTNGTTVTTSTSANGISTTTVATANAAPVVFTSVANARGAQSAKTLAVNEVTTTTTFRPTITTTTVTTPVVITTTSTTPRTATTVTTTPTTVTTTSTTPVTITTTTTPVTVDTYSDNTTVTTNGTPVVTTSAGQPIVSSTTSNGQAIVTTTTTTSAPIVTTTTSAGTPIVASTAVTNAGTPTIANAVTNTWSTRIDGYSRAQQSSGFINQAMTGGVNERFAAGENGVTQRIGAFGDEKQGWMYIVGEGTPGATSDGYKNKNGIYGLGYERLVRSDLLVGASFAQGTSTLTADQASAQVDKQIGTVYSLYTKNGWALNTTLGHSDNKFYNTHSITALNLQNGGTTNGTDTWLHNRLYTPAYNNFKLLAGVRTDQTRADGFTEAGAPITAMTYAKVQQTKTTSEYGARWDKQFGAMMVGAEYSMNSANLQTTTVMVGFTPRTNIIGAIGVRNQRQDGVENTTLVTNITVRF